MEKTGTFGSGRGLMAQGISMSMRRDNARA
jgi:hypothetical protein